MRLWLYLTIEVWLTLFSFWFYLLIIFVLKVINTLNIKAYCLDQISQMISLENDNNNDKEEEYNEHQSTVKGSLGLNIQPHFPNIECMDVYSIKSVGKMRKFFMLHWKGDTLTLQKMLLFLIVFIIIFLIRITNYYFSLGWEKLSNDYFSLTVTIIPIFLITPMLIKTLLISAKINDFFSVQTSHME